MSATTQGFYHPTLMPGSAKARRGVDCVTEFFLTQTPLESSGIVSMVSTFSLEQKKMIPEIERLSVFRILIKGARGLRDTDFHPGVDKSDPYCTCQLVGKPESKVVTHVINDCLDPEWNYVAQLAPFEPGDSMDFKISDYDPGEETLGGDDTLGTLSLDCEDALASSGPTDYPLENDGNGYDAYLTLEIYGPCIAWPSLTGMDAALALETLGAVHPELTLELLDAPTGDETYPVVSWDSFHKQNGYKGRFFGAFEDDARFLQEGDHVEVFPNLRRAITSTRAKLIGDRKGCKHALFAKLAGECGPGQIVAGKMVRYIYLKDVELIAQDGMQWRRIPKKCKSGFFPNRVCVYRDPKTNTVVGLVGNG